jgi:uncharacterized HhH-GPD family protein
MTSTGRLQLAQVPAADDLLARDPFALLVGMLLDQQFPMERAFAGPYELAQRLGHEPDARELAAADPDELAAVFATPPVVHRYPRSMAGRVQELARHLVEHYDGRAEAIWADVPTGLELRRRLEALPGFGRQKAAIFVALLGKQLGVQPAGWREAAGAYGEEGARRSVADVVDADSLQKVRDFKKATKAAARGSD